MFEDSNCFVKKLILVFTSNALIDLKWQWDIYNVLNNSMSNKCYYFELYYSSKNPEIMYCDLSKKI